MWQIGSKHQLMYFYTLPFKRNMEAAMFCFILSTDTDQSSLDFNKTEGTHFKSCGDRTYINYKIIQFSHWEMTFLSHSSIFGIFLLDTADMLQISLNQSETDPVINY